MDSNFNHEQSLSLINEMIIRARNNVKQQGAISLIYWGYLTASLAIINSVLLRTLDDPSQSSWVWVLMAPAAVGSYLIERRLAKKRLVKTHIDKIAGMIWAAFLCSFVAFMVVIVTVFVRTNVSQVYLLNTPSLMIMVGMGQFISACVYRNRMWYAIASTTWIGAIVCAFLAPYLQLIIFAVCMILGFVVPGHILNHQAKKSHV